MLRGFTCRLSEAFLPLPISTLAVPCTFDLYIRDLSALASALQSEDAEQMRGKGGGATARGHGAGRSKGVDARTDADLTDCVR